MRDAEKEEVPTGTPDHRDATQRRVYALPAEMVDRIVEFQKEKGLQSEVEAVRRLLDNSLKSRDNPTKIINRFLSRLSKERIASEVAKSVLVGHPLVKLITFTDEAICFTLLDGFNIEISDEGDVKIRQNKTEFDWLYPEVSGPGIMRVSDDLPF